MPTHLRYMSMLSLIPARPAMTTAGRLHEQLSAQGYTVSVRTVERDLQTLSTQFPLVADEGKPRGWSWMDRDERVTFPPMNLEAALTYELLSRYLAPIFPRGMLRALEPEFVQARRALEHFRSAPVGRWVKRIAALPYGQQLLPPEVKDDVREVVYDALLHERCFEVDYRAAGADKARRYVLHPLGLVYREGVLYLVAVVNGFADPRHFALQRMSKAWSLDEAAVAPDGFDFQRYIREEKAFDYPLGRDIRLELVVDAGLAHHLAESRLSRDQTIARIRGRDESRVTATVTETEKLVWWLRSLGPGIEVVKPASLRRRMKGEIAALARMYG